MVEMYFLPMTSGLSVKNLNVKQQIAGTRFEAPYIYKHGEFYYLFCSIGACCESPYYDKEGEPILENACSIFLTSNDAYIAPDQFKRKAIQVLLTQIWSSNNEGCSSS